MTDPSVRQSSHMLALIAGGSSSTLASPGLINIRFGNHCDLDEISQVSSSRWHSTFSWIVINCIHWHLTFRNCYLTCRPQFGAPKTLRPGADVPPCPPLVTPLCTSRDCFSRKSFCCKSGRPTVRAVVVIALKDNSCGFNVWWFPFLERKQWVLYVVH